MSDAGKEFLKFNAGQVAIIMSILAPAFIFYAKFEVLTSEMIRVLKAIERHDVEIQNLKIEIEKIKK
jgi:hypothetical protein